jgi:CxxC motif-containing protein
MLSGLPINWQSISRSDEEMNEETKIICVACPKGCQLKVNRDGDTFIISDQGCKKGEQYAKQEMTDPRRMVATTVQIVNGPHPLLPVYTAVPFPKTKIKLLLRELKTVKLKAPIQMGQVVMENAAGTGINIIASRDMK